MTSVRNNITSSEIYLINLSLQSLRFEEVLTLNYSVDTTTDESNLLVGEKILWEIFRVTVYAT